MSTMRRFAMGLALAIGAIAPAAAADPALPKGWVAGSGKLQDPPKPKEREFGTLQSNHEFTFRTRNSFQGMTVDLASLPLVEIEPSPIPKSVPTALPEGPTHEILVIKKGAARRVTIQGFEAGFVEVGNSIPLSVGRQSEGGASNVCTTNGMVSLSYGAIRRVDKAGNVMLVWGRGFLDNASCRAVVLERHTALLHHIAGGVLFGFRTHCAACEEGKRDELHIVTPQIGSSALEKSVAFEHRSFMYGPGKSAAFEGTSFVKLASNIGTWSMPDFGNIVKRDCKPTEVFCSRTIRLEVSQGIGESAPTMYVGGLSR
jgi:hypothetical protein